MTQTEAFEQVVARFGWPALVGADRRGLAQQLEPYRPTWLVLWPEQPCDVAPPQSLISWLRERVPRPPHVELPYRREPNSAVAFRAAGDQSYLPVFSNVGGAIQEVMWQLPGRLRKPTGASSRAHATPTNRLARNLGTFPELSRPP